MWYPASGVLTFSSAPDYENPGCGASDNSNTCVVILQVTDGTNTDTLMVTATVTDLNEADPVFTAGANAAVNVAEGDTAVGTYTATDTDGTATQTYSIVAVGEQRSLSSTMTYSLSIQLVVYLHSHLPLTSKLQVAVLETTQIPVWLLFKCPTAIELTQSL